MPIECDLKPFTPVPTPAVLCATNYSFSQSLVQVLFDSKMTQKQEPKDEDIYELVLQCIRDKKESVKLTGNEVCYYAGFEPNNIVSLEEMTANMKKENWNSTTEGDTEFKRVTQTDKQDYNVTVDTEKGTVQNNPSK